jgi:hypothetical protein
MGDVDHAEGQPGPEQRAPVVKLLHTGSSDLPQQLQTDPRLVEVLLPHPEPVREILTHR